MTTKLLVGSALALSLAACGSDSDSDNTNPSATLTASQSFVSNQQCPAGGIEKSTGSDTNGNGVLDKGEITTTDYECTDSTPDSSFHQCDDDVCTLYGRIEQNFKLTADKSWLITKNVVVGRGDQTLEDAAAIAQAKADGVELSIEPGTRIQALADTSLTITRGSKILAKGTAEAPIVFAENDAQAVWNGLIIEGFAPVYPQDDQESDAQNPEQHYGGDDLQDNSGVLSHVVLSRNVSTRNSNTALTLLGTGSQTQIDHIQVSGFDHVDIVGGGTNISNLFMVQRHPGEFTGVELTIGYGYKGNLQNLLLAGTRDSQDGSRIVIEGDQTEASLSNILLLPHSGYSGGITTNMSPVVNIYNSLVYLNPDSDCMGFETPDQVTYQNLVSLCSKDDLSEQVAGAFPLITDSGALNTQLNIAPITPVVVDNGSDFVFSGSNYLGPVAYGTDIESSWWSSWTLDMTYALQSPPTLSDYLAQPDFVHCSYDMTSCSVIDDIDQNYTLKAATRWVLRDAVNVGVQQEGAQTEAASPVVLTIESGSDIFLANYSSLTINKSARLIAEGTSEQPIIFRSNRNNAPRGVVIQGGNNPEDNSSILSYATFKDMGFYHAELKEYFPALTLNHVGHHTKINHLQIDNAQLYKNYSGFLVNGGSVNLESIVTTHSGGITLAGGYKGNVQNLINIGQRSFIQTQVAEGDSAFTGQASISNFLAIGTDTSNTLIKMGKHSEVRLNNGVLSDASGTTLPCIAISDDGSTTPSQIHLLNVMDDCQAGLLDPVRTPDSSAGVVDVSESGLALSIANTGAVANSGITAIDLPEIDNGSDFKFDDTDYMGAIKPGTTMENAWWYGWTIPGSLDSLAN